MKTIEKEPFNLYSQKGQCPMCFSLSGTSRNRKSGLARLKHIGHQLLRNRIFVEGIVLSMIFG